MKWSNRLKSKNKQNWNTPNKMFRNQTKESVFSCPNLHTLFNLKYNFYTSHKSEVLLLRCAKTLLMIMKWMISDDEAGYYVPLRCKTHNDSHSHLHINVFRPDEKSLNKSLILCVNEWGRSTASVSYFVLSQGSHINAWCNGANNIYRKRYHARFKSTFNTY